MRKLLLALTGVLCLGMLGFLVYYESEHEKDILSSKEELAQDVEEEFVDVSDGEGLQEEAVNEENAKHFFAVSDASKPNNELQDYVPSQVRLEGNQILLTANPLDNSYVSGKVESIRGLRYGTFAFRIETLQDKGLFPAIWMLPMNGHRLPELDLYEMIGSSPRMVYGALHYMENEEQQKWHYENRLEKAQIHRPYVLRIEWTPEHVIWTVDGVEIVRLEEHVPDQPMYMIVNLAIGGNWPGNPDREAFPRTWKVEVLEFNPWEVFNR